MSQNLAQKLKVPEGWLRLELGWSIIGELGVSETGCAERNEEAWRPQR